MQHILHTLPRTGGSGFGFSSYRQWAKCGKAASLSAQAKESVSVEEYGGSALEVGTLFHLLVEYYYRGDITEQNLVLEFGQDSGWKPSQEDLTEAMRLFQAYRTKYAPTELGDVLQVEVGYGEGYGDRNSAQAVGEAVGIYPFSCRVDLVVSLSGLSAGRLGETRGITINPGIWLVDHKTAASEFKNAAELWENDLQMTGNVLAYNAQAKIDGRDLAQGILINTIYKRKVPGFTTYVHTLDENKIQALRTFYAWIGFLKGNVPEYMNAENCFSMGRTCKWFTLGRCSRGVFPQQSASSLTLEDPGLE
jgi:hypothetical protein